MRDAFKFIIFATTVLVGIPLMGATLAWMMNFRELYGLLLTIAVFSPIAVGAVLLLASVIYLTAYD